MAPEQGPDSKSVCGKKLPAANEAGSDSINDNGRNDTLEKDSIGWIYLLRKEQLIEQCKNVGIVTTGFTVDYLRKKLTESLRSKQLRASTENLLRELEREIKTSENSVVAEEVVSITVPPVNSRSVSDMEIMSTVQKWNLQYSGDSDLIEFLQRFEEFAECYQINCDRLLPTMLGVLNGNALKWYRVKRSEIRTWIDFRTEIQKFFLPKRHLAQVEQQFYNRRQNSREKAKEFVLSMLTLARQHPLLRSQDHLDRIYDGLRSEYRHYVRRHDFSTLDELTSLTDEYEALRREERPQTSHMVGMMEYRRENACWRCKRTGHHRNSCTYSPKLFCSYCGKDGVLSRNCKCHQPHPKTSIIQSPNDNRYYTSVSINGLKVNALVDTGGSRTYISPKIGVYLRQLGKMPENSRGVVQMADRTLATHLNVYRIQVTYEDRTITLMSSELPTLAEDVILGMDFLSAFKIEIRLEGKILRRPEISHRVTEALHNITSRDFLTSKVDGRLSQPFETHGGKFRHTTGLCARAEHRICLKHKHTNPTPQKYQPNQPEARPKIIQDIQIDPPATSSRPPALLLRRHIRTPQPAAKAKVMSAQKTVDFPETPSFRQRMISSEDKPTSSHLAAIKIKDRKRKKKKNTNGGHTTARLR